MQSSTTESHTASPTGHSSPNKVAPKVARIESPSPPPANPTRLLLICHAESMQRRYGNLSLSDTGLTAAGWEQASALADWLRTYETVDHLISSEQLRNRLTAQRIGQALNLSVKQESSLPNAPRRNWTLYPPLPEWQEAPSARQMAEQETDTGDGEAAIAERQSEWNAYQTYQSNLIVALNAILNERWGKTIALVTNGSAIATIIRHIGGSHHLGVAMDDTGISELSYADERWQLAYANRREHLSRSPLAVGAAQTGVQLDVDLRQQLNHVRQVYNRFATSISNEDAVELATAQQPAMQDVLDFSDFDPGKRVLDVGTGIGHLPLAFAQAGAREAVGVDLSPVMLERAEYLRLHHDDPEVQQRVSYRLAPAHSLPFANSTFDLIVCRFVLHHMVKLNRALSEFFRVLRPVGRLVLVEFAGPDDPVKRATQNAIESKRNPSHATIRTPAQFSEALTAAGFVPELQEVETQERRAGPWLDELAVDKQTRHSVMEMLEASIETDAAELNVHQEADDLIFEQQIVYMQARKPE